MAWPMWEQHASMRPSTSLRTARAPWINAFRSLISKGSAPNAVLTIRIQQVFDASGNLISETVDISQFCRGS